MVRKRIYYLVVALIVLFLFAACSNSAGNTNDEDIGKRQILPTF